MDHFTVFGQLVMTLPDDLDTRSTCVDHGHFVLGGNAADASSLVQLWLARQLFRLLERDQMELRSYQIIQRVTFGVTLLVSGVPGKELHKVRRFPIQVPGVSVVQVSSFKGFESEANAGLALA